MSKAQAKKRSHPVRTKRLPKTETGHIELLLVQSVDHLGKQGEVVRVKPGYARNFLLPHGWATIATDHHKRMVDKHRERLQAIQNARVAGLRTMAEDLGKQSVTIEANANDEGHLYGSVGAHEIAVALKGGPMAITPDMVRLQGPLKELGLYTVQVHLGQGVDAELKVWVVPSVSDAEPPAKAPSA
jgi:large subunit ribosomal protein L9